MTFSLEVKDNIVFLGIQGDLLGVKEEQKILDSIKSDVKEDIIKCSVDISEVGYMNSTGLSLLIRLLTFFRNKGGDLVLIKPSEQVRKLLVITKLNAIFTVAEDQASAVAALNR